jgi:hypothetical protein
MKFQLDLFTKAQEVFETKYGTDIKDMLEVSGMIDTDLQDMVSCENISMGNTTKEKRDILLEKIKMDGDKLSEGGGDITKPNVVVYGNEYHLFINETWFILDDYLKRLFKFFMDRTSDQVVRIYFYYTYWPSSDEEFTTISSLINAILNCKAKTIGCCYSRTRLVPAMIVVACNEIAIGNYSEMILSYPDISNWGDYGKAYKIQLEKSFQQFKTRGIITQAEYDDITENRKKLIYLRGKELKERL